MASPSMTAVNLDALPPIERDEKFDRTYIPLPGGYEVQTKGRGSSYRIYSGRDNHRWAVSDPFFHENITKMAMAIRAEHEKLIAELRTLRALQARVEGAPTGELFRSYAQNGDFAIADCDGRSIDISALTGRRVALVGLND